MYYMQYFTFRWDSLHLGRQNCIMLHYIVGETQKAPASSTDNQRQSNSPGKKETKKMEIKMKFGTLYLSFRAS